MGIFTYLKYESFTLVTGATDYGAEEGSVLNDWGGWIGDSLKDDTK